MTIMNRRSFLRNVAAATALAAVGARTAVELAKERAASGVEAWLPEPGKGLTFGLDRWPPVRGVRFTGEVDLAEAWRKAEERIRRHRVVWGWP